MMRRFVQTALLFFTCLTSIGQDDFNYSLELNPVVIDGLDGLQSYAYAQSEGRWLFVGGRRDGLHARQPFNAFPQSQNNTDLYVVDVNTLQVWYASVTGLPVSIAEQLQSTNMNYHQEADTLYLTGGYGYSPTADDHITYPHLTTVIVSGLINAIIDGNSIEPYFKQITDSFFQVTGGQLGKIGDEFVLVGGQKFTGRYNPMENPTYVQEYSTRIKKFTVNNFGGDLSFAVTTEFTDPSHLRRRDYNLLPQIFSDGTEGYMISSGVFQEDLNLPFLYPVEIRSDGYTPVTEFNQYLSNYHCAHAGLYDSQSQQMHSLFFGGLSRYYYQNGLLQEDPLVPFVKTISRLSRWADGSLHEYKMDIEMPEFRGTGAEFIPNRSLPHLFDDIMDLQNIGEDSFVIGHIFGGIYSPATNPFSSNQTATTNAASMIYEVKLTRNSATEVHEINGVNPYKILVSPNPAKDFIECHFDLKKASTVVEYTLTTTAGSVVRRGSFENLSRGSNTQKIEIGNNITSGNLMLTVSFDHRYFTTTRVVVVR